MKEKIRLYLVYTLFISLLGVLVLTFAQVKAAPAAGSTLPVFKGVVQKNVKLEEPPLGTLAKLVINYSPAADAGLPVVADEVSVPDGVGIVLADVPNFGFDLGTAPTSAAMLAGFYDRNGFPDIYTGNTNSGVIPLDDLAWGTWNDATTEYSKNPLIASMEGLDEHVGRGTIDDYWIAIESDQPDPYITGGWTEHAYGTAIGDYMRTGQSAFGLRDGWTEINYWVEGSPLYCSLMAANGYPDGLLGVASFFAVRGYGVDTCYTQLVDSVGADNGFTFDQYKAEIQAGHPVLVHLVKGDYSRTVLGVGFESSDLPVVKTILVQNAEGIANVSIDWEDGQLDWLITAVSVIHPVTQLQPCYTLTLSHSGDGADPVASPANSIGCDPGQYHMYELVTLTAQPSTGFGVASWFGTSNNFTHALSMPLVMVDANKAVSVEYMDETVIDICQPAASIALGESHTGRNDADGYTDHINYYPKWIWLENGPEYAYSFSTTFTGDVDVYLNSMSTDLDLFIIEDEGGVCRSENLVASADDRINYAFDSAKTYYIVVDGYQGNTGSYTLNIDSNDDVATPKEFDLVPAAFSKDTYGATHQAGDPSFKTCGPAVGLASVWYRFLPAADGEIFFDTFGSSYNTMLGLWQETPTGLVELACNNDAQRKLQSQVNLKYTAGESYLIGVAQDSTTETGGSMKLHATTFQDVPGDNLFWRNIEGFYAMGITGGCGVNPLKYCPGKVVTRQQMAVFLLRAMFDKNYIPPAAGGIFIDVPLTSNYAAWIEELYHQGITGGCSTSPLNYCPENEVTRAQMAIFLLRAKEGSAYTPPPATGVFADVPVSDKYAPWIEELARRGVTGGCSTTPKNYCPNKGVTRAQMATFVDRVFGFAPIP